MTPQRAKELLPIITAFANGETIQYQTIHGTWVDMGDPSFSNGGYRIKPKPVTRLWSKPEDVPGECFLRDAEGPEKSNGCWSKVIGVWKDGLIGAAYWKREPEKPFLHVFQWQDLNSKVYSTDLKQWHPCTVTEEA